MAPQSRDADAVAHEPTVGELLVDATRELRESGSETPRLDAELLIEAAIGVDRVQLHTRPERRVAADELDRFAALLARRLQHEPMQYILGVAWFRELELHVDARVLIPRPETELLVEWALEHVAQLRGAAAGAPGPVRVLDACTGSGAVAIAVAHEAGDGAVRVVATDISPDALEVARQNAASVCADVELLEGDLFAPVADRSFDVIVSNPPYVPTREAPTLPRTVREYEPHVALFVADDDATSLVGRIIAGARQLLEPGGLLAIEVGMGQADRVCELLRGAGFERVHARRDLQQIERIVGGYAPS